MIGAGPLPSLSFATRRELIEQAAPLYREASLAQKRVLLDQVITMTGSTRNYAIGLLNHLSDSKRRFTKKRAAAEVHFGGKKEPATDAEEDP